MFLAGWSGITGEGWGGLCLRYERVSYKLGLSFLRLTCLRAMFLLSASFPTQPIFRELGIDRQDSIPPKVASRLKRVAARRKL